MCKQQSDYLHVTTNKILVIIFIIIIIIICICNYIYYVLLFYINSRTIAKTYQTTTSASYGPVVHYYKQILSLHSLRTNFNGFKDPLIFCIYFVDVQKIIQIDQNMLEL